MNIIEDWLIYFGAWILTIIVLSVNGEKCKPEKCKISEACNGPNLKLLYQDNARNVKKCQQVCNVNGENIEVFGHGSTRVYVSSMCDERSSNFDCSICNKLKVEKVLSDKKVFGMVKKELRKTTKLKCQIFPDNLRELQKTNHFTKVIEFDPVSNMAKLKHKIDFLAKCGSEIDHYFFTVHKARVTFYTGLAAKITNVNGYGGNNKFGIFRYGESPWQDRELLMEKTKRGKCTSENKYVMVSALKSDNFPPNKCFDSTEEVLCNIPDDDSSKSVKQLQVNDALFWGTQFVKMLGEQFGDHTLEENCVQTRLCVMYKGTEGKSFFFNSGSCETYYSVGDDDTFPMASASLVGHELGHVVIAMTSKLENRGQSGAIADALADMFGLALKSSLDFFDTDWKFGNDVKKSGAISYFGNPSRDKKSIDHSDDYQRDMDVHYASGVYRKAMYILGNSRSWNFERAFRLFLYTNKFYWREKTTFAQGLCDLISAAEDMDFLPGSVTILEDAFAQVGVFCGCPTGWKQGKFGCYQLFDEPQSWFDASLTCDVLGAQLLSIDSGKKFRNIRFYLKNVLGITLYKKKAETFWLGGTKMVKNKWTWFPSGKKIFKRYRKFEEDGKECILLDKVERKKSSNLKPTEIRVEGIDGNFTLISTEMDPEKKSLPKETVFTIVDDVGNSYVAQTIEIQKRHYRIIGRANRCDEHHPFICEIRTI